MITLTKDIMLDGGADIGNGFSDFVIDGQAASVPSGYTSKPADNTFKVDVNGATKYHGLGVLNCANFTRPIDGDKYRLDHLQHVIAGGVVNWLDAHNHTVDKAMSLRLVFGMPPEPYLKDRAKKRKAVSAYRALCKSVIKIKSGDHNFTLHLELAGLRPEALTYAYTHKQNSGYTIVFDCGFGTVDVCITHHSKPEPITVRSHNLGFAHQLDDINGYGLMPEYALIKKRPTGQLADYFATLQTLLSKYRRVLEKFNEPITVKIIGGITRAMAEADKRKFKTGYEVVFNSHTTNAESFYRVAKGDK